MPACIDQGLYDEPGQATSTEFFKGEDAIDFVTVRMKPAPCDRGKCPINKGAENAVLCGVGFLLVIVVPDLFDKGEFSMGELTGQGGFLSGLTISYTDRADMTTIWADSSL